MLDRFEEYFRERRKKVLGDFVEQVSAFSAFSGFSAGQLAALEKIHRDVDVFLVLFNHQLSPEVRSIVLNIQADVDSVIRACRNNVFDHLSFTFDEFVERLSRLSGIFPAAKTHVCARELAGIQGFKYERTTKSHDNTICDPVFLWACKAVSEEFRAPYVFYGGTCTQMLAAACDNGDACSPIVARCRLTDDIDFLVHPSMKVLPFLERLKKTEDLGNAYFEMHLQSYSAVAPSILVEAVVQNRFVSRIIRLNINQDFSKIESMSEKTFFDALGGWAVKIHSGIVEVPAMVMTPTHFVLSKTTRMEPKDWHDIAVLSTCEKFSSGIDWAYVQENITTDFAEFLAKLQEQIGLLARAQ